MARRSKQNDTEQIRLELLRLIQNFENELASGDFRKKVLALIPAHHLLRDLGSSLIPKNSATAARDRIILYLTTYPHQVIKGDELMVISGIGEWARRVRELRVEFGWSIATGVTAKEMIAEGEFDFAVLGVTKLGPEDYVLLDEHRDDDASARWKKANEIRKKKKVAVQDKILEFLIANVGKPVTGEELRYIANNKTEWARRVRELRTEQGWPVMTKTTGRPDLPIGAYVLEENRQTPPHDRRIPDDVRRAVLVRDEYKCRDCEWTHANWNRSDPRHLELHHKVHHANRGENTKDNLITLCTVCHDTRHRIEN